MELAKQTCFIKGKIEFISLTSKEARHTVQAQRSYKKNSCWIFNAPTEIS